MFFREKTSKNSLRPILQLVENINTPDGVRQKVVVSLGAYLSLPKENRKQVARIVEERLYGQHNFLDYDPNLVVYADKVIKKIQIEGKWNSTRHQVNNLKKETTQSAEVLIEQIQHGYHRELGPLLIGHHFWNKLNFPQILKDCGFNDRQIKTSEISVLNRLIAQDSEHAIPSWINTVAVEDIIYDQVSQIGDDRFYRISDNLVKHQAEIETSLYQREKSLFNLEDSIFLYDLTNTYFEGVCAGNPKAEYGGNQKEKRTDCPQVVVAISIDGEGFIRRHQVFNGKISDAKSLAHILRQLSVDFNDKPCPTIIFDRGVVSDENLKLLEQYENLKYIIACRPGEESLFFGDFQQGAFSPLSGRNEKNKVEILLKETDDAMYLLCKSQGRKTKETAIRNQYEQKLEIQLKKLAQQVKIGREKNPVNIQRRIGRLKERYSKVAKYYDIDYHHMEFSYILPDDGGCSKKLINSLARLKELADRSLIGYTALEQKLGGLAEKYPGEYEHVQVHLKPPDLSFWPVDEIVNKEIGLDGNYLLKSNRKDLQPNEFWRLYITLTRVENVFRNIKSQLGLRPNYHQKERRVDGHIFITILAYHLLHAVEITLRHKNCHTSWPSIKRVMSSHSYSTIQAPTVNGAVINLRKPGIPEGVHLEIYQKLDIDYQRLPSKKFLS